MEMVEIWRWLKYRIKIIKTITYRIRIGSSFWWGGEVITKLFILGVSIRLSEWSIITFKKEKQ